MGVPAIHGGRMQALRGGAVLNAKEAFLEPGRFMSEWALRVRARSVDRWGEHKALEMVGLSPRLLDLQAKVEKAARYREPVLITGESGVGKEQFAQVLFLLGSTEGQPYVSVNCPQYEDGNLTVSELFGHTKGSFTGAIADRKGAFEEAHGGVIFLDEIGDLHPGAQALLLRALSTGEFKPLGASRPRSADVRVVAATNRPLNQLVLTRQFRYDLLFRLRHFHLDVPPLRDRDNDWRLILDHCLLRLSHKYGVVKRFSAAALKLLEGYRWPGNVRQLMSVVTMGYAMADGATIEAGHFAAQMEREEETAEITETLYHRVVTDGEDFWKVVHQAFMDRDLNRAQVRAIIRRGLVAAEGNHRRLLQVLRLPASDYQRFMDFLRHHDLKP